MKKLLTTAAILLSLNCFSQKVSGDTLIINSDKIKWVMIGGELYEVKRSVTLEKKSSLQLPNDYLRLLPTLPYNKTYDTILPIGRLDSGNVIFTKN